MGENDIDFSKLKVFLAWVRSPTSWNYGLMVIFACMLGVFSVW